MMQINKKQNANGTTSATNDITSSKCNIKVDDVGRQHGLMQSKGKQ